MNTHMFSSRWNCWSYPCCFKVYIGCCLFAGFQSIPTNPDIIPFFFLFLFFLPQHSFHLSKIDPCHGSCSFWIIVVSSSLVGHLILKLWNIWQEILLHAFLGNWLLELGIILTAGAVLFHDEIDYLNNSTFSVGLYYVEYLFLISMTFRRLSGFFYAILYAVWSVILLPFLRCTSFFLNEKYFLSKVSLWPTGTPCDSLVFNLRWIGRWQIIYASFHWLLFCLCIIHIEFGEGEFTELIPFSTPQPTLRTIDAWFCWRNSS